MQTATAIVVSFSSFEAFHANDSLHVQGYMCFALGYSVRMYAYTFTSVPAV